ncbi:MAG: hypothetical protein ACI9R3_004375 [Verrucomicrobiales bacterium]|jgi:hypothetical protein
MALTRNGLAGIVTADHSQHMRPILCYKTNESAETAVGSLASAEIEATSSEQSANGGGTLFCVNVQEPKERMAIQLVEDNNLATEAVRCPSCESINVEYPAAPRSSPTMNVADKVIDFVSGTHDFICRGCSHVWH